MSVAENIAVIREKMAAAAKEAGAVVDHCHLTFHGRCRACV